MDTKLSVNKAAQKLNISPQSVKRWIRQGKLNGEKENGKWYVIVDQSFEHHLNTSGVQMDTSDGSSRFIGMDTNNRSNDEDLRDEIKHLRVLLERRDRQIESMSNQIDHLSQLLAVSHKSLQQVTDQYHLLIEDHRKPSFWKRLFRRPAMGFAPENPQP